MHRCSRAVFRLETSPFSESIRQRRFPICGFPAYPRAPHLSRRLPGIWSMIPPRPSCAGYAAAPRRRLMVITKPGNEKGRIAALEKYAILDTAPEQSFDDLTLLASFVCKTPIALISLVDEDRQW